MLRDRCASHDPGSMGGFIARAFALKHANRVEKLVLLSTDSGGMEADLALPGACLAHFPHGGHAFMAQYP